MYIVQAMQEETFHLDIYIQCRIVDFIFLFLFYWISFSESQKGIRSYCNFYKLIERPSCSC